MPLISRRSTRLKMHRFKSQLAEGKVIILSENSITSQVFIFCSSADCCVFHYSFLHPPICECKKGYRAIDAIFRECFFNDFMRWTLVPLLKGKSSFRDLAFRFEEDKSIFIYFFPLWKSNHCKLRKNSVLGIYQIWFNFTILSSFLVKVLSDFLYNMKYCKFRSFSNRFSTKLVNA